MKTALFTLALAGLLAGCGGSDHDDHMSTMPSTGSGGGAAADKFTAKVAALAATQPDDSEPPSLDESAPTMPDDTEPQLVGP